MVIKKSSQLHIVLYMESSMLCEEEMSFLLDILSACDQTEADPPAATDLRFHEEVSIVTHLVTVPYLGILRHSEFLYHNHQFNFISTPHIYARVFHRHCPNAV